MGCNKAGAGKCDLTISFAGEFDSCNKGYGLTATETCAPVRTSLQRVLAFPIGAQYASLHVAHGRSAADFTMCCVCFLSAVCCKLYV